MRIGTKSAQAAVVLAGVLTLVPATGAAAQTPAPAPAAAESAAVRSYIFNATWITFEAGLRLQVKPTDYGRNNARFNVDTAWNQVLAKAGRRPLTSAQYSSLYKQFRCHTEIARYKPYWNLESWRPNVSYAAVKAAFCNPQR